MRIAVIVGVLSLSLPAFAAQRASQPKQAHIDACRTGALARLKHKQTVKWSDISKEETPGVWLVTGIRTAKGPNGNEDQSFTCRVEKSGTTYRLKMIQLFSESTVSGKDVFELFK